MQLISNLYKYFVFAVLGLSLVVALNCNKTQQSLRTPVNFSTPALYQAESVTTFDLIKKEVVEEPLSQQKSDSIWHTIGQNFELDHKDQSARVKKEIHRFLADQDQLYQMLKAAGPYIYYIYEQTQARGLPAEIALIPLIESEFNPNDHSKKGATGLWQIMPQTGRELGIKIKAGYDGRRNVIASTKAALAYFNDLGNLFKGNWYLAIAAYNCGQVKVANVSKRTGSKSYWNLPLPKETKLYVPKLLAAAAIVKNPKKYGIKLPPINNKPFFTELKVAKPITLVKVAKSSGIDIKTLQALNPDHKQEIIPKKGTNSLLVPISKATEVKEKLGDKILNS